MSTPIPAGGNAAGILTLSGYGLRLAVERGHLVVADGIANEHRTLRIPRVARDLKRVVVLGQCGTVSLDALRWLHDLGIGFVHIDNDGTLISVGAAKALDDVRVRRGQALATQSSDGVAVARELLLAKTDGQLSVLRELGGRAAVRAYVMDLRDDLVNAATLSELRYIESRAALGYWDAWANVPMTFVEREAKRLPRHWLTFGSRRSALIQSPRKATTPANAMLNYLYAVLEAEAHLAALQVGLDPAIGIIHSDRPNRQSFACDLMEAVRPAVDRFILDMLRQRTFRKADFFETREGVCRIMPPLASELSETAPRWRRLLGPIAEHVAFTLSKVEVPAESQRATRPSDSTHRKRTPITQANRARPSTSASVIPHREANNHCRTCGRSIKASRTYCEDCLRDHAARASAKGVETQRHLRAIGQDKRSSTATRAKHREHAKRSHALNAAWEARHKVIPSAHVFKREILPHLSRFTIQQLRQATALSEPMCKRMRKGDVTPHPRHWDALRVLIKRP